MNAAEHVLVVIFLCGLVAAPLPAQSHGDHAGANGKAGDRQFLKSAGEHLLAAREFSSAVKDRTPKVEVRAYAESVIAECHQMRQHLRNLASENGVTLPTSLNQQAISVRKQLSRAGKATLDEHYARAVLAQEKTLKNEFVQEARTGSVPGVRGYAHNTLAELQGLLDEGHKIANASRSK